MEDNLIGKELGSRYQILEKIGEGGMATVYEARCKLLNRYVAIKVLKSEYAKDETFVKRFRAEAQSAAALTHPNIVSVYDVGEENGINYIVMELLESKTLKDYINEHGALDSELTLKIAAQIASALQAAHKSHIIHRDIKPQNIVLNKNMVAKVTDFGIAKITNVPSSTITSFGSTMGSVHYFSPEHAKGGYTDEKSDIYSLGVVMYEMATGKLPFDADSPVSVALKHIQETPVEPIVLNPRVSVALNQIIMKAMEKSTALRYQSATELLNDISIALARPNSLIPSKVASVEAGETQVIPIIHVDDEEENNLVPNLRTRNANNSNYSNYSKPSQTSTPRKRNEAIEEDTEDDYKKGNSGENDNLEKENKGKNKKKIIIICSIIAVIVIGFGIFFGIKITKKVKAQEAANVEVEVPNVVGRDFNEVVEEYSKQGIEVVQDKSEYSSDQPEGYIISQTPEKGSKTKDKKIYVVVSKGEKLVDVPDVTGKDIKVAKYELQDTLGFVVETEEVINEKVTAGIIISQDPKKEQKPYGSTIKLVVSKGDGKESVLMPNVVGKTEADAKSELEKLKLKVNVKYSDDNSKTNGVVLSQSYPQNQELKEGDMVDITVNKLMISKTVSIDLLELQGGTPVSADKITVKVTASIDSSATNTVFEKSFDPSEKSTSFTINGYNNAVLKIYLNDKLAKEQKIDF